MINEVLANVVSAIGLNAVSKALTHIHDTLKLKSEIKEFAKYKFKSQYFDLHFSDSIDLEGLMDYIGSELIDDVRIYLFNQELPMRELSLNSIIEKSYSHANADSEQKRDEIALFVKMTLDIATTYFIGKLDGSYVLLHNITVEIILSAVVSSENRIIKEIKSSRDDILEAMKTEKISQKKRPAGSLPPNNLPFIRNQYFTGRDKILEDIDSEFEHGNAISLTQTITGMGGLGKTQTALEYAYKHSHKYEWIWWVTAETEMGVLSSYKQFAVKMGLMYEEQHDSNLIIETVLNWMDRNTKWLFIYDNADSISGDTPWWPRNNRGNILITTRNKHNHIGKKVDIGVFNAKEAVDFLAKRTGIHDDAGASDLAERLGYLPLALEQAAAYIAVNEITYKDYLSLLDESGLEVLQEIDGVINYSLPVTATLEISIKKINQEEAQQLLYLCSYMAPENIDEALFSENAELLPSPLKEVLPNRLKNYAVWKQLTQTEAGRLEQNYFDSKTR